MAASVPSGDYGGGQRVPEANTCDAERRGGTVHHHNGTGV